MASALSLSLALHGHHLRLPRLALRHLTATADTGVPVPTTARHRANMRSHRRPPRALLQRPARLVSHLPTAGLPANRSTAALPGRHTHLLPPLLLLRLRRPRGFHQSRVRDFNRVRDSQPAVRAPARVRRRSAIRVVAGALLLREPALLGVPGLRLRCSVEVHPRGVVLNRQGA